MPGTLCSSCGRHFDPPGPCSNFDPESGEVCGYVEPDEGLTFTRPWRRATDDRPFTELVRESWQRLSPDTQEAARRGIADAKEALRRAKERKGAAA